MLEKKKHYVMMMMFSINDKIVMAQNIDEAMAIYRETLNATEIKSAYVCRDGQLCYVKIATEEDYRVTHGSSD